MKVPEVVSLLLCERFGIDPESKQISLFGIFQARYSQTFPAIFNFTIYTALYDGEGEGTMQLVVTRLETEEEFLVYRKWYTFPGRGLVLNLVIPIRDWEFAAPGRYGFTLSFDNVPLTQRYMEIFRI